MQDELDLLVVGAGQAGLATGQLLTETGFSFRLQERHCRVGDSWRERYDSLVLFSSRAYSALPGLTMGGEPDGYPTKDEIADYLQRYAEAFRLPVNTADGVIRLERDGDRFVALTEKANRIVAKAVIITTGGFQEPVVPAFARQLSSQVFQLTARVGVQRASQPTLQCEDKKLVRLHSLIVKSEWSALSAGPFQNTSRRHR